MTFIEAIVPGGTQETFRLPAGQTVDAWRAAVEPAGYVFVRSFDDGTGEEEPGAQPAGVPLWVWAAAAFLAYRFLRR